MSTPSDPDPVCAECGRKTFLLDAEDLCYFCAPENEDHGLGHANTSRMWGYIIPSRPRHSKPVGMDYPDREDGED